MISGDLLARIQYLEGNSYILHLFGNSIAPIGITILLVNADGILGILGNLNPILLVLLGVRLGTSVDLRNDTVTFLENSTDPPIEGRLVMDVLCNCMFGCLYWIALLDVRQFLPCGGLVLPLNT